MASPVATRILFHDSRVRIIQSPTMKQKLTVTVDPEVVAAAKRYARSRGLSLSALIERRLREEVTVGEPSFASRWRGRFRPADRDEPRYEALARKYL